ncbi:MAG: hypothetical protein JZU49_00450 [Sulfuricurvum sp.]|nr:hypothetical protein [Sulfuricurvum sp.]
MSSKRICPVCGNPITKIDKFKPSTYCDNDACRDYSKFKTALEKAIVQIKPTSEARKVIRGDMFRLCNLLGNGTNTILEDQNES